MFSPGSHLVQLTPLGCKKRGFDSRQTHVFFFLLQMILFSSLKASVREYKEEVARLSSFMGADAVREVLMVVV